MRIKREIQMGASGGGQSIKASGHWPREQAGHKPATDTTIPSQNALDPRRASTQVPSSEESANFRFVAGREPLSAADVAGNSFGLMLQYIGDNDLGTLRREDPRLGLTHAVAGVGRDRHFVLRGASLLPSSP